LRRGELIWKRVRWSRVRQKGTRKEQEGYHEGAERREKREGDLDSAERREKRAGGVP
jgi:hypothetical protein